MLPTNYQNPFSLFSLSPTDPQLMERLHTISEEMRKRLSTTTDDTTPVLLHSTRLTRGDWQYWLEQLQTEQQRQLHAEILQLRPLNSFLEYGHLGFFERDFAEMPIFQDADFVEYIRPFFLRQYVEGLLQALKTQAEETLQQLQRLPFELREDDFDTYFEGVKEYLHASASEIKTLSESENLGYLSERELVSHLPDRAIATYNSLPEYLSEVRNWIGNAIGQIAVYMTVQLGRPDGATALVRQALKLRLDDALRADLEKLLQVQLGGNRRRVPAWLLVGIGALILLFLLQYLERVFFP